MALPWSPASRAKRRTLRDNHLLGWAPSSVASHRRQRSRLAPCRLAWLRLARYRLAFLQFSALKNRLAEVGATRVRALQVCIRQKGTMERRTLSGLSFRLEPFAMLAQQLFELRPRHLPWWRTALVIGAALDFRDNKEKGQHLSV